jgi:hypothetical protein
MAPRHARASPRAALAREAWEEARDIFERELEARETVEALEGLSWAAWWVEDVPTCLQARERAYRLSRQAGDMRRAVMLAIWRAATTGGIEATASGGGPQRSCSVSRGTVGCGLVLGCPPPRSDARDDDAGRRVSSAGRVHRPGGHAPPGTADAMTAA